jgi:PA14 domain/Immunoglobulin domain/Bacterial lectin
MKNNPHTCMRPLTRYVTNILHPALLRWTGIVALLAAALSARAASFFADFNSGLPAGTAVYGNSAIIASGGFTNSGYLQLTPSTPGQNAGFVINSDLDSGNPVYSFVAQFKAYIGGGDGGYGFSFNFAPDLPNGIIGVDGAGTGLSIAFDTYNNGVGDIVGINLHANGSLVTSQPFGGLRPGTWVDVVVMLHPDGTLDVFYDNFHAYSNQPTGLPVPITGARFGFGANTGGLFDNHWIDNVSITTFTNLGPFVDSWYPLGSAVWPNAPINILLTDYVTSVDTNTIVLKLDGSPVVPTVITQAPPQTAVQYTPPTVFEVGSSHTISLTFADNSTPTAVTQTWQYGFTVANFPTLPTNLVAAPSYANLSSPGFSIRYSQVADEGSRDTTRAESQLAGLLIDSSTGLPFVNLAAPNPADSTFTFLEPNVINYGFPAAATGDFANDTTVPGMPGPSTGTGSSYAMEAVTYLHLLPGAYTLGVNSSDGFRLTVADGADIFAPQEASFSSVRVAADSTVSFAVTLGGYYPFRLVYFTGDPNYAPAPGTATPSVEFFSMDSSGNKRLVNDTTVTGYVPAFTAAMTKPYICSVSPNIGDTGIAGNAAITTILVDQSLTVQTNTILLQINGITVTPTISNNGGISTVSYQPPTVFAPNSSNYVSLAFADSGSNRRTNTWSFTVANIMTPIWSIPGASGTWLTTGSSERGLAYNPKTGHLILVSRAAAPAPANGLGIAIMDSSNGSVLGTMNLGTIATDGLGTFKLSMVGVADDGVIYVCNLTTSGTVPFQIYRWADESAAPQLVYSANPIGGAGRCGDDFRVRGSGAGTEILASGNTTVTTIPIFTTTDGTNFTGRALSISGIAANVLRLGLAFGCGNTFYGETTSTAMSCVGYNPNPSTAASLTASYAIYDKNTNQWIGPIGFDIANQRLIGDQSPASTAVGVPHCITLYDVPTLATTPTQNFPIDQRNFASQNTSFGTGSIDFTPDGSRVFCLDTGNGIIAFNLAPRVAPITICAQPKTNIVAGIGSLGFMDVGATGAPQKYQWRFNATSPVTPGTPILNATNRTLDIYNVQQSQFGFYSVVISNSALQTSVTSSVALLVAQMAITSQPASQVVAVGGTATLTVGVTNGLPAYSYQWKLNGTNVGPNSSSYVISNAQVTNAGAYTVVIADSGGQTVTSQTAALTVGTLGTGTGLTGDYYSSQALTFLSPPTLERLDSTVNFDWVIDSPDPSISADTFTARWTGFVQPLYSQTYALYTTTDDGTRLWVNGQLLVDKWVNQASTEWSGTIALTANKKYPITMEYFENTGNAVAKLSWSSTGQVKEIIPQTQLYPSTGTFQPTLATSVSQGTNLVLNWTGTFALESAPQVTGPWTPITTNIGPFTVNMTLGPQMFYRLLLQ